MTARARDGLTSRLDLSAEERAAILSLAAACNAHEGLDLKLEIETRPAGAGDDGPADVLYYTGGSVAGYCGLDIFTGGPAELCGMVAPAYRRRGIGRALLGAAMAECARRGRAHLLVICEDASASGRAFVAARGAQYRFSEHRLELRDLDTLRARPPDNRLALRRVGRAEMEAIARVRAAAFDDHMDEALERVAEDIDDPGTLFYLACLADGTPIGTLKAIVHGGTAGIYGFGVIPARQGQGHGRAILARTIEELWSLGYTAITIEVETDNSNALGLYTSCGFKETTTYGYYRLECAAPPA